MYPSCKVRDELHYRILENATIINHAYDVIDEELRQTGINEHVTSFRNFRTRIIHFHLLKAKYMDVCESGSLYTKPVAKSDCHVCKKYLMES